MRVLVETKVLEKDWMRKRYEQLALIDEKMMKANTMRKVIEKGLLEHSTKW